MIEFHTVDPIIYLVCYLILAIVRGRILCGLLSGILDYKPFIYNISFYEET